jgi:hypothetical protein
MFSFNTLGQDDCDQAPGLRNTVWRTGSCRALQSLAILNWSFTSTHAVVMMSVLYMTLGLTEGLRLQLNLTSSVESLYSKYVCVTSHGI